MQKTELPGMMYVRERNADSIWPTELAFCETKSSYECSQFPGLRGLLGDFAIGFRSSSAIVPDPLNI